MKVLIAGLGSIGRRHLRNLSALGVKDIILLRTQRSTLPDDELQGLPVVSDIQSALAFQPDAVIVSNPTALHLDVAIPAAESGCHLFLEKPVSHSMQHVEALRSALRRGGGQVYVGFQFRFHPGLQQVERLLAEGAIGEPLSAHAHYGEYLPSWHPWEDYRQGYSARPELGGGVILTLCHPLDYLRWFFGEVATLWAFAGTLSELEIAVEDTAEIGLRFVSGLLAGVHLDYFQRPTAHWLEIIGAAGTMRWDNSDGTVHLYRAAAGEWELFPAPQGFERNDLFLEQTRHFLAVARGEAQPVCTLEDGVRALELALAARRSAETGLAINLGG
jgi:predicted dehydrogenase